MHHTTDSIGGLFGVTRREKHKTELFIFLTPRILKNDDDVDSVTAPRLSVGEHP